ncbi:MAG: FtsQ-type POTRA domain-containing protein [Fibrobacterota bacterium]|nr:FtsQ-type POTRA domain-containing protein [Fibrobacterota bacterium]QQS05272.1 MAG: FtsQ-type POTRA domain-containing protein [Fibrobacterota bacterium]
MSGPTLLRNAPSGTIRSRRQGTNARLSEVTRMAARTEKRERMVAQARSASPMVLLAMVAIGLLVGAGIWIWKTAQDPRWTGLQTIRVQSDGRVGALEAARATGLVAGRNLFSLDLDAARKRLQSHPWIAQAEVSRDWLHGVRIRLRERTPVARLPDGNWIARDGVVLDPRGNASLSLLSSPIAGRTKADTLAFKNALLALEGMKASGRTDLEVKVLRGGSLEVRLGAQEPIALVSVDGWKTGLSRWSVLRAELGERWRTFSEIDLRHGSCAALRRAQGGT